MREDLVFDTIRQILTESGNEEFISLSTEPNRLADFMVYKQLERPDYLAINGRPIVPLHSIDNILYSYGSEGSYNYVGTFLQLIFELEGDARFIWEDGDDGPGEIMQYKGEWYSEGKSNCKVMDALAAYNQEREARNSVMNLFYSVAGLIEGNDKVAEDEVTEVNNVVWQYLKENPTDLDFLYSFAYTALKVLTYEEVDPFHTEDIIKRVIELNAVKGLISDIEHACADPQDYRKNGYYLTLITNALRLIREVRNKM